MAKKQIEGEDLNESIIISSEEVFTKKAIIMNDHAFALSRHDFSILRKGTSDLLDWSKRLFQIGIGVAIQFLAKLIWVEISLQYVKPCSPEAEKLRALLSWIDIVAMAIAFGASYVLKRRSIKHPSDRDELISKIKEFFNPKING